MWRETMENLMKKLSEIILAERMEELNEIVKNPDSFTLELRSQNSDTAFHNSVTYLDVEVDEELKDLLFETQHDGDLESFVDQLKQSSDSEVVEYANFLEKTFVEKIGIEDVGLDLEGKSLSSLLWAATIYKHLTTDRSHIGTTDFSDVYEKIPVVVVQELQMTASKKNREITIQDVADEVVSIFENSSLKEKLNNYLQLAFTRNVQFRDDSLWYDYEKNEEISLNEIEIDSPEKLLEALKTPTAENYQAALEYVAREYFSDCKNDINIDPKTLQTYKSLLVVSKLSSSLIEEEADTEKARDYNNIALNLLAKESATGKLLLSDLLSAHIIEFGALLATAKEISNIVYDSLAVSSGIVQDAILEPENDYPETFTEIMEEDDEIVEQATSSIKTGTRKDYVNAYLKIFDNIINAKLTSYLFDLKQVNALKEKKVYKSKAEDVIMEYAKKYQIESLLKTKEEVPDRTERLHMNTEMIFNEIRNQTDIIEVTKTIFAKAKRKIAEKLVAGANISDFELDKRIFGDFLLRTREQHKVLIREFYSVLAGDHVLKGSIEKRYVIPSQDAVKARFKGLASTSQALSFTKEMPVSNTGKAQAMAYDLYVGKEGELDEKYKDLYEALTSKKLKPADKAAIVFEAQQSGIITENQYHELIELLPLNRKKKNEVTDSSQITIDDINDDEGESEIE